MQAEAARLLGVNQPKVSALRGYKLEGFSVERLMHFATALQHDVVIEIRPRATAKGAAQVLDRLVEWQARLLAQDFAQQRAERAHVAAQRSFLQLACGGLCKTLDRLLQPPEAPW